MKSSLLNWIVSCSCLLLSGCVVPQRVSVPVAAQQRAQVLIDNGTRHLRNHRYAKARASFVVAEQLHGTAAALDGLGCVSFMEGDFTSARDYFLRAIARQDTYAESYSHLALLYDFLGYPQHAEMLFRRALSMQPADPIARNNHGVTLLERSRIGAAKKEFYNASVVLPHKIINKNITKIEEMDRL